MEQRKGQQPDQQLDQSLAQQGQTDQKGQQAQKGQKAAQKTRKAQKGQKPEQPAAQISGNNPVATEQKAHKDQKDQKDQKDSAEKPNQQDQQNQQGQQGQKSVESSREKKRILISGAGPIGLSFALGLKESSLAITIVDQHPRPTIELLNEDTRMIALSYRSVKYLEKIDIWQALKPYATPIESVHVSEKGYATKVELFASEHHLQSFGALVPLGRLRLEMLSAIDQCPNIEYRDQTALRHYQLERANSANPADKSHREVARCQLLSTKSGESKMEKVEEEIFDWVIAAEGMHSHLRQLSGIESFHSDYGQVAVIARAKFEHPHHNMAYERFTSDGPLALLPVGSHEMAVVLIADSTDKAHWQQASDLQFANEVIFRLGYDLGEIESVTERHVWDLTLMVPKEVCKPCLTLIGNSAHSLHPIAGQGLNLGFRDCELLLPYFESGNIPTLHDLERYQRARRKDVVKVVGATDFLVRSFGIDWPCAPQLRNIALRGINFLKPLKKRIARFGMGY